MDLQKLTLKQAVEDLKAKKYSSKELTNKSFENINSHDEKLKAFISLTKEQALKAAEKFDSGKTKSIISGIPGSIKDIYNWIGTTTTASSKIIKNYVSPYSATVVQRLVDNDAVIIGKTNMDAFAHGSSTETSDFFTSRNPWDTDRLPGGSSGGR